MSADRLKKDIITVDSHNFNELTLEIFHFQVKSNPVYARYVKHIKSDPLKVVHVDDIPYLPISFFKNHVVSCKAPEKAVHVFESSSTTGLGVSKHLVYDLQFYLDICQTAFELFYAPLREYRVLALLPGYLERQNSSLVYMARHFIEQSDHPSSGFYLHNLDELVQELQNIFEFDPLPPAFPPCGGFGPG